MGDPDGLGILAKEGRESKRGVAIIDLGYLYLIEDTLGTYTYPGTYMHKQWLHGQVRNLRLR